MLMPGRGLIAILLLWTLLAVTNGFEAVSTTGKGEFAFTNALYYGTVQEKSAVTTAVESSKMMGMWRSQYTEGVRFSVIDDGSTFSAQRKEIGDFIFLDLLSKSLSSDRTVRVRALSRDSANETFCTVVVKVRDINDFQPLFPPVPYDVTIPEDTPIGKVIANIRATDSDTDPQNKRFYYSFPDFNKNFAIHPTTGDVILTAPVQRRTQITHSMRVRATDRKAALSNTARPKETTLSVTVTTVNKHAPKVIIHKQLSPYDASKSTDDQRLLPNSHVYAILDVSDPDSGENGEIEVPRIIRSDQDGLFVVLPGKTVNEFLLVLSEQPPAVSSNINVTLKVSDRGKPPKSTIVTVEVKLYDMRALVPHFLSNPVNMSISEASPAHSQVGFVEATTRDRRYQPKLLYAITSGNGGGLFRIDGATSLITIARRLNRSVAAEHVLTVRAINTNIVNGDLRNSTRVIINVQDANNNDPEFTSSSYSVNLPETTRVGSAVIRVQAVDKDFGKNGSVLYKIVQPSPGLPFEIDSFSGQITTTTLLDHDTMGSNKVYDVRVRAFDCGSPFTRKSDAHVYVTVTNVNDNPPMFRESSCSIAVPKTTARGSKIAGLGAFDIDVNPVECQLVDGARGKFKIEPGICMITLERSLSRLAVGTKFPLRITATDGHHTSSPIEINITVTSGGNIVKKCTETGLLQAHENSLAEQLLLRSTPAESTNVNRTSQIPNDFRPMVVSSDALMHIRVQEDAPLGSTVFQVNATDLDTGFNGKMWYAITSGNAGSSFSIDPQTGEVTILRALDREARSSYDLTIAVSDMGSPPKATSVPANIFVTDVNDNAPRFDGSRYEFTIPESAPVGFTIKRPIYATDRDEGPNAVVRYSISDGTNFAIDPTSGYIRLTKTLDWEIKPEYRLTVTAKDGGSPPLSSIVPVTIHVQDSNDNQPKFLKSIYRIRLAEDLPTGTVVFWLRASDLDTGANARLHYSLTGGNRNKRSSVEQFTVDPLTGAVRLARKLRYSAQSRYNITANVRENFSYFSVCYLEVEVLPENRNLNAPYFEEPRVQFTVRENLEANERVGTVSAVDLDLNDPERDVGYYITDGTGMGFFRIDHETGTLYTTQSLDRESEKFYWLTVKAEDRAPVPLSGHIFVLVEVTDVNDNAPLPSLPAYFASIAENSPRGSEVLQISANDRDETDAQMTFNLLAPNAYFHVDPETGIITTRRKLNREDAEHSLLEFYVEITDSGSPPLSSTVKVVVTLDDVNNNVPKFMPDVSRMIRAVVPSSGTPVVLGRVVALDPDQENNSIVEYKLKSKKFSINATTGVISTSEAFTPVRQAISSLKVRAVDRNLGKSTGLEVKVNWIATDDIEESPISFVKAARNERYLEHVDGTSSQKRTVDIFKAEGGGSQIRWFSIEGGNDDLMFYINPVEGTLLVAGYPDSEKQNFYNLTLQVTDGRNTATTNVAVAIDDANDHRPYFDQTVYRARVPENAPVGSTILTLEATDSDVSERNRNLVYQLRDAEQSDSLEKFRITNSGVILTKAPLDRESQREHILTVEVDDQGVPGALQGYCRVIITIDDVNEHAPRFTSDTYSAKMTASAADADTVGDDVTSGDVVLRVHAIDADHGDNARVVYSIAGGNDEGVWRIDSNTGEISSTVGSALLQPGSDTERRWRLAVKATDCARQPLSSTTRVNISARPSSDAPPQFEVEDCSAKITENAPVGSFIFALSATSSIGITYEISEGNEAGHFAVNQHSGVVTLARALDREMTSLYNMTVTSSTVTGLSSYARLVVTVLDVNDNRPVFEQLRYSATISTGSTSVIDSSSGQPLVLRASDPDKGFNAQLVYRMIDLKGATVGRFFEVDANMGAVRPIAGDQDLFSYDTPDEFNFQVTVRDSAKPPKSSHTNADVTIHVTKRDDSPPRFSASSYVIRLVLPLCKGVIVASNVTATSRGVVPVTYSIYGRNEGSAFEIDPHSGVIKIANSAPILPNKEFALRVRASDGKRSTSVSVTVTASVMASHQRLRFTEQRYMADLPENSTQIVPLALVAIVGTSIEDNIKYSILNSNPSFEIGSTSGVVSTTGVPVDRETHQIFELLIEAKEIKPNSPKQGRCVISINVTDVNDNSPLFVGLPYYASVQVDAAVGTEIKKVVAIDEDAGNNGKLSYRLEGSHSKLFKVNPKNGSITVRKQLSETFGSGNAKFNLSVVATDFGVQPLHGYAVLRVSVVNRATPVFKQPFYGGITVSEGPQKHTVVSTMVKAESPDEADVYYSIEEGDPLQQFDIDFSQGTITTLGNLDREEKSQYRLRVRARDSQSRAHADVTVLIDVTDLNDNAPIFASASYESTLLESAPVGSEVVQIQANDKDAGSNGHITYDILEDEPWLDGRSFLIDSDTGMVWTANSLDSDVNPLMKFVVRASDGGSPPRHCDVMVTVRVGDINDNAPVFGQVAYEFVLSSESSSGYPVGRVRAYDPDISDSDKLVYSLRQSDPQEVGLVMNPSTGLMTVGTNPPTSPLMTYTVSVTDGVFVCTSPLVVRIISNDTKIEPVVFRSPLFQFSVGENLAAGRRVGKLRASGNGRVIYEMVTDDQLSSLFRIDASSGNLYTRERIDREAVTSHIDDDAIIEFVVMATDERGWISDCLVRVTILDTNDNAPVFGLDGYATSIVQMDAEISDFVLQVSATDPDSGSNGTVAYSWGEDDPSNAKQYLNLNMDTGIITIRSLLRHLGNVPSLQFFVRASDRGDPQLSNVVGVSIFLVSHPGMIPTFVQRNSTAHITEDVAVGSQVAEIQAEASEESVTYELAPRYITAQQEESDMDLSPTFEIDRTTGVLSLLKPLDREAQSSYDVTVFAYVSTTPDLVSFMTLTVIVGDVNDNDPRFSAESYQASVVENQPAGTDVITVLATDRDTGKNGDVTYRILSDEAAAPLFAINSSTGAVTTVSPLDREQNSTHLIAVQATDGGERIATCDVTVHVVDVNDVAPTFSKTDYALSISESARVGSTTAKSIRVIDADTVDCTHLDLFISDGDPNRLFEVIWNRLRGDQHVVKVGIKVVRPLDRDAGGRLFRDSYDLTLVATDGLHSNQAHVLVTIDDVNDNPPTCEQLNYEVHVRENVPRHFAVVQIDSKDRDAGNFGTLQYTLSGKGSENFIRDRSTGRIFTAGKLDREKMSEYRLTVTSTDGGDLSCTSSVHIIVDDVNDNAPEFDVTSLRASTKENIPVNSLLHRVIAYDPDLGKNGTIRYTLRDNFASQFVIEPSTGILILRKPLDRETKSSYELEIVATDGAKESLSSIAVLNLQVIDVNDNPPIFEHTKYNVTVAENLPVGRKVATVSAVSRDSGANAKLRYTITHGNEHGKFAVNEENGEITLISPVDYENDISYVITVTASDRSENPLSGECTLNVVILDVNDNTPVFTSPLYEVSVSEDTEEGRVIAHVSATDRDSNDAGNVTYYIDSSHGPFQMDSLSGDLSISSPGLDYESRKSYTIPVTATDGGNPAKSSTADVFVHVTDVNDVRPRFLVTAPTSGDSGAVVLVSVDGANCTVHIHAGSTDPVQRGLAQLNATDGDGEGNGAPFSFRIFEGNEKGLFYLDADNIVKTRRALVLDDFGGVARSHRVVHQLLIDVTDSGKPRTLSAAPHLLLNVVVLKRSQYPPELVPHSVVITTIEDQFDGGAIVDHLRATDRDVFDSDRLRFSLASPEDFERFFVSTDTGAIKALAPISLGDHSVLMRVSDGSRSNISAIPVKVRQITKEALEQSLSITFSGIGSLSSYISLYHKLFVTKLRELLPQGFSAPRDLLIISLMSHEGAVELLFSVRKPPSQKASSGFYQSRIIRLNLEKSLTRIEDQLRAEVESIKTSDCLLDGCNFTCRQVPVLIPWSKVNEPQPVSADSWSLVTQRFYRTPKCVCPSGTMGPECKSICSTENNPCKKTQRCVVNPNEAKGYRCTAAKGTPKILSFDGAGYAKFEFGQTLKQAPFHVNFRLRTFQSNATIFHASGPRHFAHLEVANGLARYTFDCGGGPQTMERDLVMINDGKWHDVDIQPSEGSSASCAFKLTLDHQFVASLKATGGRKRIQLTSMTLGGVPRGARSRRGVDTRQREARSSSAVITRGFRGCLESPEINETPLPTPQSSASNPSGAGSSPGLVLRDHRAALDTCTDELISMAACFHQPCRNGGTCLPHGDGAYVCNCPVQFNGDHCEEADPCARWPCQNKGVCLFEGKNMRCKCPIGFAGERCETPSACHAIGRCRNHGTCVVGVAGTPSCFCASGWSGQRCEIDVDECATEAARKDCGNKAGSCHNFDGGYACNCTTPKPDPRCPISLNPTEKPEPTTSSVSVLIIVIICVIILFIGLVVLAGFLWRRKRLHDSKYRRGSRCSRDIQPVVPYNADFSSPHAPRVPERPAAYQRSSRDSFPLEGTGDQDARVPLCYVRPQLPAVSPSFSASDNDSIQKPPPSWQEYDAAKYNDSASSSGRHGRSDRYKTSNYSINDQQIIRESPRPPIWNLPRRGYDWDVTDWKPEDSGHVPHSVANVACGGGPGVPGGSCASGGRGAFSDLPSSPESRRSLSSVATNRSRRSNRSDALPGHYCNSRSRRREKQLLQLVRQEESIPEEDKLCITRIILNSQRGAEARARDIDSRNSSLRSSASSRYRHPLHQHDLQHPVNVHGSRRADEYKGVDAEEILTGIVRESPPAGVTSEEPESSSTSGSRSYTSDTCPQSSSSGSELPPPPTEYELRAFREDEEVLEEDLPPALANNSYSSLLNQPYEVNMPTPCPTRSAKFHPDQYLINHHHQTSDLSEASGSALSVEQPRDGAPYHEHKGIPPPPVRLASERLSMSSLSEAEEEDSLIRDQHHKSRPKRRQGKGKRPRRQKRSQGSAKHSSEAQEMQPLFFDTSLNLDDSSAIRSNTNV